MHVSVLRITNLATASGCPVADHTGTSISELLHSLIGRSRAFLSTLSCHHRYFPLDISVYGQIISISFHQLKVLLRCYIYVLIVPHVARFASS